LDDILLLGMATNAWNRLQQIGVEIAIVLLIVGMVWAAINPIFQTGIQAATAKADAKQYTATKGALNVWSGAGSFAVGLLMLSAAVYTIIQLFAGRGRQTSLLNPVLAMIVFFVIVGAVLFQTAIPAVIDSEVIADATLAAILNLLYVGVILASVGVLVNAVQTYRESRSRKKQEATISIFGR